MSRSRVLLAIGVVVIAIGIGGFIVYDQVLRGDSAAALTLPTASSTPAATQRTGRQPGRARARARLPRRPTDDRGRDMDRRRRQSVAGYRVREQLANLPAESDAVGRTDQVTGSITLESSGSTTTLTAGALTVDTTSITSDKSQRDNRMRDEGLQTDQFPTATFTLTKPVEIPAAAAGRDRVGRHPDRRPDPPRRHEVGRDPGQGAARQRHDPGRRLAHVPALGLLDHGPEHRRVHRLDRRHRHARVPGQLHQGLTEPGRPGDPTGLAAYFV